MKRCKCCGQTLPDDDTTEATAERLRQYCADHGLPVFAGDRVTEATAAELLGMAVGSLRNWRYAARPLPFIRSGSGRGRVSYYLRALAEHLRESGEE